jgi:hypothetical protein
MKRRLSARILVTVVTSILGAVILTATTSLASNDPERPTASALLAGLRPSPTWSPSSTGSAPQSPIYQPTPTPGTLPTPTPGTLPPRPTPRPTHPPAPGDGLGHRRQ